MLYGKTAAKKEKPSGTQGSREHAEEQNEMKVWPSQL